MKKQTLYVFEQMSKSTLQDLTEEVKEIIAKGRHEKNFSSVDLWNIQKSKKSIPSRRAIAF